ncbi:dithiol-disulfide isomerase [Phenylobacterium zucineum HLK1]|uniref:Dithiol-disulfide isomerase n=1 Tax=Phenylobacterium zucineum (strain HLK1) TaxID=450851 RepID=B4RCP2_PHEZH|nr:DsbA family protein [Phenylobacterium zucineum]ACG78229.1 dithiol-disulfide isomerase [Phenylobacterium zucineum HLK1]
MNAPHLIYFADPMCSWCYGFSPVIEDIHRAFGRALPIRVVMGGLRPGTDTPMTDEAKAQVTGHWRHVHEATGLPFDEAVLDREGFLYDTDPAARAVVVVRREGEELAAGYLGRLQRAFYAENRDVTSAETLADLAAELGVDRERFLAQWDAEDAKMETWRDYAISQRAGVTGFPTLVAGPNAEGAFGVVTRGYAPSEPVVATLRDWISSIAA